MGVFYLKNAFHPSKIRVKRGNGELGTGNREQGTKNFFTKISFAVELSRGFPRRERERGIGNGERRMVKFLCA